jgi:hypothetical protein
MLPDQALDYESPGRQNGQAISNLREQQCIPIILPGRPKRVDKRQHLDANDFTYFAGHDMQSPQPYDVVGASRPWPDKGVS